MANRPVDTPIIDRYDENDNPIYRKIRIADKINIMRIKLENKKETNGFVSDDILIRIIKKSMLENIGTDGIETTDLIIQRDYLDISRYTDYSKFLSTFIRNKIGTFLNISFDDFLRKNMIEIDSIINITDMAMEEMSNHLNTEILENSLNTPEGIL